MYTTSRLPFFFFNDTATTEIYTLSLHDALPIFRAPADPRPLRQAEGYPGLREQHVGDPERSEEHTSELQSPCNLVCRLLLEKKYNQATILITAGHRVTSANSFTAPFLLFRNPHV